MNIQDLNAQLEKLKLQQAALQNEGIFGERSNETIDSSIFIGADEAKFESLVQNGKTLENGESIFTAIDSVGAQNVFGVLDVNGDGKIDEQEIKQAAKSDGDSKSISNQDLKMLLTELMTKITDQMGKLNGDWENGMFPDWSFPNYMPQGQSYYNVPPANGYIPEPAQPTDQETVEKIEKEEIPALEKEKTDTQNDYDTKIKEEQQAQKDLVNQDKEISQELKNQYNEINTSLNEVDTQINDKQTQISQSESQIFSFEKDISTIEGTLSTLDTAGGTEEQNAKNKETKSQLSSQLESLKQQKEEAQNTKQQLETDLQQLQTQKEDLQKQLDSVNEKIAEANPELKTKIEESKKKIEELKQEKQTKIDEIDTKIEAKKAEVIEKQKTIGEKNGKNSNGLGQATIDIARKYLGMNEADGSYKKFTNGRTEHWCADFVSYVVKETYQSNGKEVPAGFGSASVQGLMDWGKQNNCYTRTADMGNKAQYMSENVKTGDIIIFKENGRSHTGIVTSIDANGKIHTIEGNTSDKVAERSYDATNGSISGFVRLP